MNNGLIFLVLFFQGTGFVRAASPVPTPLASGEPKAACDCKCPGTGVDNRLISIVEGVKLVQEFQKAQSTEVKALEHRNRIELKEYQGSQKNRFKDWQRSEGEERRKFFRDHQHGPQRRQYVQEFIAKRDMMVQTLKQEQERRATELEAKLAVLKKDQEGRLREFRDTIDKGERPAIRLWP